MPPATTVNCSLIEGAERDTTQDWLVPRSAVPTVSQLEARIDEAVVIARASEEGVREVGEMAVDAARQARRAAQAAEESARAAAAARDAAGPPAAATGARAAGPVSDTAPPQKGGGPVSSPPAGGGEDEQPPVRVESETAGAEVEEKAAPVPQPRFEERFRRFSERADRLSGRLRRLGAHPSHVAGPSVGAVRRRGDG